MKRIIGSAAFVVGLGALATFDYALYLTVQIGTCASGTTPYLIARQCPPGAGLVVALLVSSLLVGLAGLVAAGTLLSSRAAMVLWAALFVPIGILFFAIAHAIPQAVIFYGLSLLFVGMGATPLFLSAKALEQWNL